MRPTSGGRIRNSALTTDEEQVSKPTSARNAQVHVMLRLPRWISSTSSPLAAALCNAAPILEEFLNRLRAVLNQRQRPILRSRQFLVRIKAKPAIKRGGHVSRCRGPRFRGIPQFIRLADHLAALD